MKYPWKDYSGRTSPLKLAVGEHKSGLLRPGGAVARPLVDQPGARLALRARPADRAFLVVDVQRVVKISVGQAR
jgi:hypothetical protein